MKTHFRTLLLLGFTGLVASLSGCIIETTSNGNGASCADDQYFQIYWQVNVTGAATPLTCPQAPPSHVELVTNTGVYRTSAQCQYTPYMGVNFDFVGSTNGGVPVGTYVTTANLISDTSNQVISIAPGRGPNEPIVACYSRIFGFVFDI